MHAHDAYVLVGYVHGGYCSIFPGYATLDRNNWDIRSIFLVLQDDHTPVAITVQPSRYYLWRCFSNIPLVVVHHASTAIKILVVVKATPQKLNLMSNHWRVYVQILTCSHYTCFSKISRQCFLAIPYVQCAVWRTSCRKLTLGKLNMAC